MTAAKTVLKALSRRGPLRIAKRLVISIIFGQPEMFKRIAWSLQKTEESNFYYEISDRNKNHAILAVAVITGIEPSTLRRYAAELENDQVLATAVAELKKDQKALKDSTMLPGRRLIWYLLARATKPKVILETGVHNGLGAYVLGKALLKNASEGHHLGEYFGTDINEKAGALIENLNWGHTKVLIGDSIDSIESRLASIDLYVSDSDHSAGYERRELEAASLKLSPSAVIVSDNAHATDVLAEWSEANGRNFLFLNEVPIHHWYSGAGAGISYPKKVLKK